ncbi:MAG: hypothetical protein WCI36_01080 [bacterium]
MYIKIKHIKQFLIIFACISLASWNYFAYAQVADATKKQCNKAIDSDCDGLTNSEEILYGTNPENSDSDGDGYSDGVEVASNYDPTIAAPNDKITTGAKIGASQSAKKTTLSTSSSTNSLTNSLISELKTFKASKGNQAVTSSDMKDFLNTSISEKSGTILTWENLPETDITKIKTINQAYASLSINEKKAKIKEDAYIYTTKIQYLFLSNSPMSITSDSDMTAFEEDLKKHMYSLSTENPDLAYFSDLGNRVELFLSQVNEVAIPETLVPTHIKLLRLLSGFLLMRNTESPINDPVAAMIMFKKIENLNELTTDFLQNDVQSYFDKL